MIIAGGYDPCLPENVEYFKELQQVAEQCRLKDKVHFYKNISHEEKVALLKLCDVFVYPPSKEHFGIGPLEAMYMGKPVIAINDGGPTETVSHRETGWLTEPKANRFSNCMLNFVCHPEEIEKFGKAGRKRILDIFSYQKFVDNYDELVQHLSTSSGEDD